MSQNKEIILDNNIIFNQCLKSTWESIQDKSQYIGQFSLIRDIDESGNTILAEIYFGSRKYAEYIPSEWTLDSLAQDINDKLTESGILDLSGNTRDIIKLIEDSKIVLKEGTAIDITEGEEGTTISVKKRTTTTNVIDTSTSTEIADKNYLKLDDDGALTVKGVDADSVVVAKDIKIAGGPLAPLAIQVYPDGVLPAGETLQLFLFKMLCKEIYPSVGATYSYTPKATGNLTVSVDGETYDMYSYPVGTKVNIDVNGFTSSSVQQKVTVSGMTNGYYLNGDPEQFKTGNYVETKTVTPTGTDTYDIKYRDFYDENFMPFNVDKDTTETTEVFVSEYCTVNASQTSKTYTPYEFTEAQIQYLSNQNNVDDEHVYDVITDIYTEPSEITKTKSIVINGYFPIYWMSTNDVTAVDNDDTVRHYFLDLDETGTNPIEQLVNQGKMHFAEHYPTRVDLHAGDGMFMIAFPSKVDEPINGFTVLQDPNNDKSDAFGSNLTTFVIENVVLHTGYECHDDVTYTIIYDTNAAGKSQDYLGCGFVPHK